MVDVSFDNDVVIIIRTYLLGNNEHIFRSHQIVRTTVPPFQAILI